AFFSLMHCCGLRTGETRHLEVEHVNLTAGYLDIVAAKANRSRRIPITEELVEVLAACHADTSKHFGVSRAAFFVSAWGNPVTPVSVAVIFNRIWDLAGLVRPTE